MQGSQEDEVLPSQLTVHGGRWGASGEGAAVGRDASRDAAPPPFHSLCLLTSRLEWPHVPSRHSVQGAGRAAACPCWGLAGLWQALFPPSSLAQTQSEAEAEVVFLAVLLCQPPAVSPCLASGLEAAHPCAPIPHMDQRQELRAADGDKGPSSWQSAPLFRRLTMTPKVPPVGPGATLGSVQEAIGVVSPLGAQQNK